MMAVIPYLKTLSDSQLLDIAAFYSSQPPAVGQAKDDAELLALGESLYKAGDLNRGIPCLLYTSPSPRDLSTSRMPSSA